MVNNDMFAVIATGGSVTNSSYVQNVFDRAELVIGADSGAATALQFNVVPDVVIGDFDSLDPDILQTLRNAQCAISPFNPKKDETDTELAIQYALDHGADSIAIVGGIEGDRIDHIVANVLLLIDIPIPVQFVNGNTVLWLRKGPATVTVSGKPHDTVSLILLSALVSDITTHNLAYPLTNEHLRIGKPRGVSNVMLKNTATIAFKHGTLLFVHSR